MLPLHHEAGFSSEKPLIKSVVEIHVLTCSANLLWEKVILQKELARISTNVLAFIYAVVRRGGKQIWKTLKTSNRNIARARLTTYQQQLTAAPAAVKKADK